MTTPNHILVPVDFSKPAEQALNYAIKFAKQTGANTVSLLFVHTIAESDPYMPFAAYQPSQPDTENLLKQKMRSMVEGMDTTGMTINYHVRVGNVDAGILQTSKELEVDLIVIGMRGLNYMVKKLFGTTATNIMQRAEVPVIVVPEQAEFGPIEQIAYLSNFEKDDIPALEQTVQIAAKFGANVQCLHLDSPKNDKGGYKMEIIQKAFQHEVEISNLPVDNLSERSLVGEIEKYVEENGIDLMIMLTHSRSLVGQIINESKTRKIAKRITIPLLVFQSESTALKKKERKNSLTSNMA